MLVNAENLRALRVGFQTLADGMRSNATPKWSKVAMSVPSSAPEELYGWLGKFPQFRKWEGDRVLQNLSASSYRLRNEPFENTIAVERDDIEDDKVGLYNPMFEQLGHMAGMHPDKLVFDRIKNGHVNLCYDGQPFFDDEHPVVEADNSVSLVANDLGGGGTPWFLLSTAQAIKPFIFQKRREYQFVPMDMPTNEGVFSRKQYRYGYDCRVAAGYGLWQMGVRSKQTLNAANYGAARAALASFKADGGEPLDFQGDLLVVPPSLEEAALEVLQAERLASGATNVYRGTAAILMSSLLA